MNSIDRRVVMKLKITLLIIAITLSGCWGRVNPPPVFGGIEFEGSIRQAYLEELRGRTFLAQSFKALYRVKMISSQGSFSQRYVVLLKRPEQIKLDILPVNGAYTIASFSVKDGISTFVSPPERYALVTKDFASVIDSALGFYLHPKDLMGILLGSVESTSSEEFMTQAKFYKDSDYSWLVYSDLEYWMFDGKTKDLAFVHLRNPDNWNVKFEVEYNDYIDQGGARIPKNILIKIPDEETIIEAKLTSAGVNLEIPDDKFRVNIPIDFDVKSDL